MLEFTPLSVNVCDNGKIFAMNSSHYWMLEPSDSDGQNRLIASHQAHQSSDFGLCRPSPQGDFLIRELTIDDNRKVLVIEGMRQPISLEVPGRGKDAFVTAVAVSPLRELAAVKTSDGKLTVFSLSGAKPVDAAQLGTAAAAGTSVAPIVYSHTFPEDEEHFFADLAFGCRPNELHMLTRQNENTVIDRTITFIPPAKPQQA